MAGARQVRFNFGCPERKIAGVAGNHLTDEIIVDVSGVSAALPGATYAVIWRRPDRETYPAAVGLVPDGNGAVRYLLTAADTAVAGTCRMAVRAEVGRRVARTAVFELVIARTIGITPPGAVPEAPKPGWVDEVTDAAGQIRQTVISVGVPEQLPLAGAADTLYLVKSDGHIYQWTGTLSGYKALGDADTVKLIDGGAY